VYSKDVTLIALDFLEDEISCLVIIKLHMLSVTEHETAINRHYMKKQESLVLLHKSIEWGRPGLVVTFE
jgi:hypothetical protein